MRAASLVARLRVVEVVPTGSVPEGWPLERTGRVVSTTATVPQASLLYPESPAVL
jgi:hypothetical protein